MVSPYTLIGDYRIDISTNGRFPPTKFIPNASPNSSVTAVWKMTHLPTNSYVGMGLRVEAENAPTRAAILADEYLGIKKNLCDMIQRALKEPSSPPSPQSSSSDLPPPSGGGGGAAAPGVEMVSWVDSEGRDLCCVKRSDAHSLNLLHRGAGILVRNGKGQVYVHQRSANKKIFPSMYDMFVGGVSHYGEDSLATARREVFEELGLGGPSADMRFMFSCVVATELNRCYVDVYEYVVNGEEVVKIDQEEVQWGSYMDMASIKEDVRLTAEKWVPDGLQVWNALFNYYESANEQKGADPE